MGHIMWPEAQLKVLRPLPAHFILGQKKNTIYLHPELENRVFWLIRLLPDK